MFWTLSTIVRRSASHAVLDALRPVLNTPSPSMLSRTGSPDIPCMVCRAVGSKSQGPVLANMLAKA
ncbi:hypothetical protein BKM09_003835 [Pseudomonas amygdali pv. morsprunorum]|nr:hypothetical protein BKM09_003835 [Pseudomonas amygdali pv. morsprunorum]